MSRGHGALEPKVAGGRVIVWAEGAKSEPGEVGGTISL